MLSVWSERVDVYLSAGLLMVQRAGAPLWILEPPVTLPLIEVLQQADMELDRKNSKPWRLRIYLSAAYCPPVAFTVPSSVKRPQEVMTIAKAHAAQGWSMSVEQVSEIVCSLDARHLGLAASMLAGTHDVITRWAQGHKGRLVGLQPLWGAATRSPACNVSHVSSLAVLEPDALSLLELPKKGAARAMSSRERVDTSEVKIRLAAFKCGKEGLDKPMSVAMAFGQDPVEDVFKEGPSVWAGHWRALP